VLPPLINSAGSWRSSHTIGDNFLTYCWGCRTVWLEVDIACTVSLRCFVIIWECLPSRIDLVDVISLIANKAPTLSWTSTLKALQIVTGSTVAAWEAPSAVTKAFSCHVVFIHYHKCSSGLACVSAVFWHRSNALVARGVASVVVTVFALVEAGNITNAFTNFRVVGVACVTWASLTSLRVSRCRVGPTSKTLILFWPVTGQTSLVTWHALLSVPVFIEPWLADTLAIVRSCDNDLELSV
jgi:hypothetical protein